MRGQRAHLERVTPARIGRPDATNGRADEAEPPVVRVRPEESDQRLVAGVCRSQHGMALAADHSASAGHITDHLATGNGEQRQAGQPRIAVAQPDEEADLGRIDFARWDLRPPAQPSSRR